VEYRLKSLIESVPELIETAKICQHIGLPNFYIAGGAITQLIWNNILGQHPLKNIKDFDIVYFDDSECQTEKWFENVISTQLSHSIKIDIKNQANVHKWYPEKFGQVINAYTQVEQGIDSWLSAFSIGFTLNLDGSLFVYSSCGLEDAFNMKVKPNKVAMSEQNYLKMTNSFKARWPVISVEPWE